MSKPIIPRCTFLCFKKCEQLSRAVELSRPVTRTLLHLGSPLAYVECPASATDQGRAGYGDSFDVEFYGGLFSNSDHSFDHRFDNGEIA